MLNMTIRPLPGKQAKLEFRDQRVYILLVLRNEKIQDMGRASFWWVDEASADSPKLQSPRHGPGLGGLNDGKRPRN